MHHQLEAVDDDGGRSQQLPAFRPGNFHRRACSPACSSLHTVLRDSLLASIVAPKWTAAHRSNSRSSLCLAPVARTPPPASYRRAFHTTSPLASQSPSPRITYRVAASSSGKGRRFHPAKNSYDFNPDLHPAIGVATDTQDPALRRKRRPDSGEDAFFVSRVGNGDSGAIAFAVADGVGGWAESRVDPADFSHALCSYMAQSALAWDAPAEQLRSKHLLQVGYDQVVADNSVPAGGSTASVGVGLEDGRIELANLGDSGSVLLRLAAVHHYSVPQTHGFNTPYQLSIIPPRMRAQASVFGGAFLEDFPRDAAVTNLQMQHGDVLVLATDGVFDNLNNQDILKLVSSRMVLMGAWTSTEEAGVQPSADLQQLTSPNGLAPLLPTSPASSSPSSPSSTSSTSSSDSTASSTKTASPNPRDQVYTLQSLIAATIAGEAKLASTDMRRDGPFAKEAQRYYPGDWYRGGKVDDISVVVIIAVEEGYSGFSTPSSK
ncbi:type 2C protein phosphatase PTC7 [Aspergillus saccharolyticus JOP 1030-1]|uniref:Protein phosphatase n=1 Tax=Aspergillus saccharolyticus JOP 1030-1 TaxID=1450539 RepID=A0A319AIZ6_9EURO|nr:protein serine/threonine phosphatase 2C [Aspergillus saccharolyticus JOP 1030-1]PYH46632.1 protein serine/threonine phosphatase 2C [Aspergillus saccharolyticus JOP 1030-1]